MEDRKTGESSRQITGRQVVLAMLAFGVLMVGAMWLYWEMYTRPFRALQIAIAAEFPESSPRAIGGRNRSHETGSPATLRIIVRVDFDPNLNETRSLKTAERLAALAAQHTELTAYELLDVHLMQIVPEKESPRWSLSRPIEEWGLAEAEAANE